MAAGPRRRPRGDRRRGARAPRPRLGSRDAARARAASPAPDGFARALAPLVARRADPRAGRATSPAIASSGVSSSRSPPTSSIPRPETRDRRRGSVARYSARSRPAVDRAPAACSRRRHRQRLPGGGDRAERAPRRRGDRDRRLDRARSAWPRAMRGGSARGRVPVRRRRSVRSRFAATRPWVDVLVSNPPVRPARRHQRHARRRTARAVDGALRRPRRSRARAAAGQRAPRASCVPAAGWIFEFGDGQEDDVRRDLLEATDAWSIAARPRRSAGHRPRSSWRGERGREPLQPSSRPTAAAADSQRAARLRGCPGNRRRGSRGRSRW